jgi:hypothetical protein
MYCLAAHMTYQRYQVIKPNFLLQLTSYTPMSSVINMHLSIFQLCHEDVCILLIVYLIRSHTHEEFCYNVHSFVQI